MQGTWKRFRQSGAVGGGRMSIKPILFNTDMVRAIMDGRKTVTRRVIKPQPKCRLSYTFAGHGAGKWSYPFESAYEIWGERYRLTDDITEEDKKMLWKPPCHTDDILYVRETWQYIDFAGENNGYVYRASENGELWETESENWKWRPSIHMPKEAARIYLKVTNVRVERLQEIKNFRKEEVIPSENCEECFAVCGGCDPENSPTGCDDEIVNFAELWDSTTKKSDIGRYGWDANPWVWVIEFERCEKPEGWCSND